MCSIVKYFIIGSSRSVSPRCVFVTKYTYYCINVNLFIFYTAYTDVAWLMSLQTDDSTEGLQTEDLMTDLNCVQLHPHLLDFPTQPLPGGFFVHNSRWVPKRSESLVGLRQRHTSVSHWQLKAHFSFLSVYPITWNYVFLHADFFSGCCSLKKGFPRWSCFWI